MDNFSKFSEFIINEMGAIRKTKPEDRGSMSYLKDWNKLLDSNLKDVELCSDKLDGDRKLYRHEDVYYLASKEDEYLGHIEVRAYPGRSDIVYEKYTNSNLNGGFYIAMFNAIFKGTKIKEILSDIDLTDLAFKAYTNLNKKKAFDIRVISLDGEYIPFSKKNFISNEMYRISIKQN